MRDIRSDLQDRAHHIEEQLNGAQAHFERRIEQLQSERDARIAELNAELAAVSKLLESETRRLGGRGALQSAPQAQQGAGPQAAPQSPQGEQQAQQQTQPLQLGDLLLRTLGDGGSLTKEELRDRAVQDGYFPDADAAARGVYATLFNLVRGGRMRQLPDGTFGALTVMDTIRLRKAM